MTESAAGPAWLVLPTYNEAENVEPLVGVQVTAPAWSSGSVALIDQLEGRRPKIIDASTAHRTAEGWVFGFPELAAGQKDAEILTFLRAVNQAAVKYQLGSIYISFQHEPDSMHHRRLGAPVQFLQAWDHIHQLAANAGLNWNQGGRLHWVLILIHDSYAKSWRVDSFWPGPSEVDILAADGYNSFGCGSGGQSQQQTPSDTFGPIVSFAAAHGGMPVFLAEWGSDDIPAGTQATYINQMQSFVANNTSIAGAMYWDTHVGVCDYKVDGRPASISALAAMGKSAALQGHV